MSIDDSLPNDVATLQSMLVAERAARLAAQSEAQYRAVLIEKLKFAIKKLRHERFGQSAERGVLLEQLELELADLEEDAGQAEAAARIAAAAASAEHEGPRVHHWIVRPPSWSPWHPVSWFAILASSRAKAA